MVGKVYETDFEKGIKLEQVGEFDFEENTRESERVTIFPEFTYQTWLGFGGAFAESSGYTLSKMSAKNQEKMINAYFGKDGIGYSFCRNHINSCDFSLGNYRPVPPQPGPFLLFCGDSITQSAYTSTPSLSFPRLLSRLCGGQYLNRGVGSLYFDASVLDPADTCRPDVVFVEFGANDMVMRDESNNVVFKDGKAEYYTEEKLPWLLSRADTYLEKAARIYSGARICCITVLWSANEAPQWRRDMQEAFRTGAERICRERGLTCIDGRTLTPHLAQCYAADGTHLNALGGALAAQNLYLALNNQKT